PEDPVPGVHVSFAAVGAKPVAGRIVADLTGDWGAGAPDPRVPADGFEARWSGLLLVQSPGTYRFFARTDGTTVVRIAGKDLADGTPIELKPGFTPIALEYRHRRGEALAALDWEGPGFAREPTPARLLFHDRQAAEREDRFEYGRRAADRYGCANCHVLLDLPPRPKLGPPLADAARAINPAWLQAWLIDPTKVRSKTRMPAFGHGLTTAEAADLAAFLAQVAPKSETPPTNEVKMALNVADGDKGRLLFRSLGCLGCHVQGAGGPADPIGPDLSHLGRKRSQAELASYLVHSKTKASKHRADFRLSADESAHLAKYLTSGTNDNAPPRASAPGGDPGRGRAIAERARCASCHEIPGLKPQPPDLALKASSRVGAGCLAAEPAPWVPRFALAVETRKDLAELVAGLPREPSPTSREARGQDALRRWNCVGCHTRDGQGGSDLGGQVAALLAEDPDLGGKKGTLTPPNLTAVGDKLRPEYLSEAIHGAAPTARPWLSVRMPAFAFEPGEAEAIAALFRNHDRMRGEADSPAAATHPDARTREKAAQLIGQRGFGCVSCHVLAGRIPPGGEPETLGPDLALAHRRMTERYFHRWIANPQRIIAGTPMPQFLQPVATAPGTLDDQLDTLWQLLGSTQVGEVAAFGTREILKRDGDRALVVRDMVLLPDAPATPYTPRALAIGLKNDHSLLFDADRLTWLSWWRGGFLSRTKSGRLWEWHPDGHRLWIAPGRPAPVVLLDERGTIVAPAEVRERFGSFRELDFDGSGVVLTYTLNLPDGSAAQVVEHVQPIDGGWERAVRVSGVPPRLRAALVESPPVPTKEVGAVAFSWSAGPARLTLRITDATPVTAKGTGARVFAMSAANDGSFAARVRLNVTGNP
ncbi:MAG: c-type cytochrome, partial [Isosphaeraceae bacterium]|nr:c-type cytochrome [Isosphaeraceae bacterium]